MIKKLFSEYLSVVCSREDISWFVSIPVLFSAYLNNSDVRQGPGRCYSNDMIGIEEFYVSSKAGHTMFWDGA